MIYDNFKIGSRSKRYKILVLRFLRIIFSGPLGQWETARSNQTFFHPAPFNSCAHRKLGSVVGLVSNNNVIIVSKVLRRVFDLGDCFNRLSAHSEDDSRKSVGSFLSFIFYTIPLKDVPVLSWEIN